MGKKKKKKISVERTVYYKQHTVVPESNRVKHYLPLKSLCVAVHVIDLT